MVENSRIIKIDDYTMLNQILWKMHWVCTDRNILIEGLPKLVMPDEEFYMVRKMGYLDFLLDLYYSDVENYENNM